MDLLHSKKLTKKQPSTATQKFLDVSEIKEDAIVLKNGSLRAVLAVSAINYDLKSTDEQEAIISQYQNFLNSIDFPIQISITSKKINIPVIRFLKKVVDKLYIIIINYISLRAPQHPFDGKMFLNYLLVVKK